MLRQQHQFFIHIQVLLILVPEKIYSAICERQSFTKTSITVQRIVFSIGKRKKYLIKGSRSEIFYLLNLHYYFIY
jgi:hypothetical protein